MTIPLIALVIVTIILIPWAYRFGWWIGEVTDKKGKW